MVTYFETRPSESERLMADASKQASGVKAQFEIKKCPITREHIVGRKRTSELFVQVKHNCRDEMMIWSWAPNGCVVHEKLLSEFEKDSAGFKPNQPQLVFAMGLPRPHTVNSLSLDGQEWHRHIPVFR